MGLSQGGYVVGLSHRLQAQRFPTVSTRTFIHLFCRCFSVWVGGKCVGRRRNLLLFFLVIAYCFGKAGSRMVKALKV